MSRFSTLPPTAFGGLAAPGGVVTAAGLRQSISRRTDIITADQIPTGAEIVRIENPPQYINHPPPPAVVQETVVTPPYTHQPDCCEQISPCCVNCCYSGYGAASNLAQGAAQGTRNAAYGVRQACPWWLWLIIGIIGLFLLAGVIFGLVSACGGLAKSAWEGTKTAASGAWEGAKNVGRAVGRTTSDAARGVASGMKSVADTTGRVASGAWEGTKNVASGAWEGAKNVGSTIGETASDAASGAWEGAKSVGRTTGELASNAASGISSGVKSVASTTGDVANAAWEGTKSAGRGVFEGGRSLGEGVGRALSHENVYGRRVHEHYYSPEDYHFRRVHFRRQ